MHPTASEAGRVIWQSDDERYRAMLELIDRKVFTDYRENRAKLCRLFLDPNVDLNEYRELIQKIAVFTVTETDSYWAQQEKRMDENYDGILETYFFDPYWTISQCYHAGIDFISINEDTQFTARLSPGSYCEVIEAKPEA